MRFVEIFLSEISISNCETMRSDSRVKQVKIDANLVCQFDDGKNLLGLYLKTYIND